MNIGGYKIHGFSKRFIAWAALAVFLLAFSFYVLTRSEPAPDPTATPAFSASRLADAAASDRWIDGYIDSFGLRQADSMSNFLPPEYQSNVGLPFRFKVYVPPKDALDQVSFDRPSLTPRLDGWQFLPSVFVNPTSTASRDDLQAVANEALSGGQPLVLGFPEGETPAADDGYEITGLLYWNTRNLTKPSESESENDYPNSPVVLVSSFRPLAAPELEAPTTHRADLDIIYREGDLQIDVVRVDWSAGSEVRSCIRVSNNGLRDATIFDAGEVAVDIGDGGGFYTGDAEDESTFADGKNLAPGQEVSGYVSFAVEPSSGPTQPLTLQMPSLLSGSGIADNQRTKITVNPGQFHDVAATSNSDRGTDATEGCSNSGAA